MSDLKQLGQELLSRNSIDSAMAVYTIISDRYETGRRLEDKVYAAEAQNSLGVLSFLSSNYVDAYSHFVTAIEMDGRADAPGYLNLSAIYLYYGDRRRAPAQGLRRGRGQRALLHGLRFSDKHTDGRHRQHCGA